MNTYADRNQVPGLPPMRRDPLVPNAVLGMLIFVMCEAMLFAGLISAYAIVRTTAVAAWPPAGQPRLPVEATAFNTLVLLLSGVLLFVANRAFRQDPKSALRPLGFSIALGAFFVAFQGYEWLGLIREGLTLTSSNHGSFFYLIVGTHAAHAVGAIGLLANVWWLLRSDRLLPGRFYGAQILWYFVVGLWPVLYVQVYLS